VTFAPDEIDWDDEVRLAIEGRAALSPDALTGMEANLRFVGPETMETKIFGRLTRGRTGSSSGRMRSGRRAR
jgi:benzoyl-CoA-dihydrodiol lyase